MDDDADEADFYQNPTILSRLVLNRKYASAMKRLERQPDEARVWICIKRNPYRGSRMNLFQERATRSRGIPVTRGLGRRESSGVFSIDPDNIGFDLRQLPIHIACRQLPFVDSSQRPELETLITHLAVQYPESCGKRDHSGKLALHEAIWHNASPETISILLMACPSTLHERDEYGRTPMDLNRFRSGDNKEEITTMLLRGTHFWEKARNKTDADAKPENGNRKQPRNDRVEPVKWTTLDQRAIHLERLLAEMYEKNYELGEMAEDLKKQKKVLEEELEELREVCGDAEEALRVGEVPGMQDEKEELMWKIEKLEADLQAARSHYGDQASKNQEMEFLEKAKDALEKEVDELRQSMHQYITKIERLELMVDGLVEENKRLKREEEARASRKEPPSGDGNARKSVDRTLSAASHASIVDSILKEAERQYGRPIPTELADVFHRISWVSNQRESTVSSPTRGFQIDHVLVQAERSYGPIPKEIKVAVQAASNHGSNSSGTVRGNSPFPPNPREATRNDPEDNLETILKQAEAIMGRPIPGNLKEAFRNASIHQDVSREQPWELVPESDDSLEAIIDAAQRSFGMAFPPKLVNSLREASFERPSGRKTDSGGKVGMEKRVDVTEKFDDLLLAVEKRYGEEIPREIQYSLREAHIAVRSSSIVSDVTISADLYHLAKGTKGATAEGATARGPNHLSKTPPQQDFSDRSARVYEMGFASYEASASTSMAKESSSKTNDADDMDNIAGVVTDDLFEIISTAQQRYSAARSSSHSAGDQSAVSSSSDDLEDMYRCAREQL